MIYIIPLINRGSGRFLSIPPALTNQDIIWILVVLIAVIVGCYFEFKMEKKAKKKEDIELEELKKKIAEQLAR
jgi:hypothetical protein